MTNPRTTKTLQLYGAAISSGDSCGCQDYTKAIELRGVTLVDDDYLATLQARVAELERQLASRGGVPDGWKLVPVEPTPEMEMAANNHSSLPTSCEDHRISIWRAMLAAAPSPEGKEAEASDYPECSGDPASCPENEGYGCCKPNAAARQQEDRGNE